MEEAKRILDHMNDSMAKALSHLETELTKIRAGKASPQMLDNIHVDYYGTSTPLNQVANVNTTDARTLVVQPWEKSMLQTIEKAIMISNLGFNPQNDGLIIRINVPALTEERRKDLVKKTKAEAEHAKVGIRAARKDAMEAIKKSKLTEDEKKVHEDGIQKTTDGYIIKVDKHIEVKEKEIMTV
ncbi:MAG: ribosome recycling factor [Bacteroidia bacterium]